VDCQQNRRQGQNSLEEEAMIYNPAIEGFRVSGPKGEPIGAFTLILKTRQGRKRFNIIVGNGGGWDHVSVSNPLECPTWEVMSAVKNIWFGPLEVAMQLHVTAADHINQHPNCLHIWRPQTDQEIASVREQWGAEYDKEYPDQKSPGTIPLPPKQFV
jgi:hypothetical protein